MSHWPLGQCCSAVAADQYSWLLIHAEGAQRVWRQTGDGVAERRCRLEAQLWCPLLLPDSAPQLSWTSSGLERPGWLGEASLQEPTPAGVFGGVSAGFCTSSHPFCPLYKMQSNAGLGCFGIFKYSWDLLQRQGMLHRSGRIIW